MQHKTILGIDPGTKEMGLAVLRGDTLLAYGVRTLRNGEKPYDLIGQARRIVLSMIEKHAPQIVAIEPGHDGWVVGKEPVVLIEFDFEGDTISKLGMPDAHRH